MVSKNLILSHSSTPIPPSLQTKLPAQPPPTPLNLAGLGIIIECCLNVDLSEIKFLFFSFFYQKSESSALW